jgi:hypothetical protein
MMNIPLPKAGERTTPPEPAGMRPCGACVDIEGEPHLHCILGHGHDGGHYVATHTKASIEPVLGFAQARLGEVDPDRRVAKWIEQTREHAIECGGITTDEAVRWLGELHDLWLAVLAEYQREAFDAGKASSHDTLTAIARDIVDAEQWGDWEEAGRRIALKVERAGVPLPDHRRIL